MRRIEGRDAAGGIDYDWALFASARADVQPARVISRFAGEQIQNDFDTLIELRHLDGVRTDMRVEWDLDVGSPTLTKIYEISGVRTPREVRHQMFLHCTERQAEGFRKG